MERQRAALQTNNSRGGRRPTLKEVSEAAEVSLFTASRALNGEPGVAAETRAHVSRVAQSLGYVPNQLARSLRQSRSRSLGVLTANTFNPYYAVLVGAIGTVVLGRGFQTLVGDAAADGVYSRAREDAFVAAMIEQRVAGVVATHTLTDENVAALKRWGIAVLFVDCLPPPGHTRLPCVTADNIAASRQVGDHFAAHGRRRWAYLGFTPAWSTRAPRERGFVEAAQAHGADVVTIEGGNDRETAYRAMTAFLDATPAAGRPDALYATNTLLLHGAVRALRERGVRVPADMALIAFDEFDWAPLLDPPITVVDQHTETIGAQAGRLMLALLDADASDVPHGTHLVAPTLRLRASCGCPA